MNPRDAVNARDNISQSAIGAKAIVAGTRLPTESRAVYVGGAGNMTVTMASGEIVTFTGLEKGIYPFSITLVSATALTASNLVALY